MSDRALKVLIVDDSTMARRAVSSCLEGDYEVVEAENGSRALGLAKNQSFDLVISDINMPIMGGFELARLLRAIPSYANTPIFALTTESDPVEVAQGKAVGVTAWIIKPVKGELLRKAISAVLSRGVRGS